METLGHRQRRHCGTKKFIRSPLNKRKSTHSFTHYTHLTIYTKYLYVPLLTHTHKKKTKEFFKHIFFPIYTHDTHFHTPWQRGITITLKINSFKVNLWNACRFGETIPTLRWELQMSPPPALAPQGIPLSLYFSVIKNTMMNAYYFQMNNLEELAADKANSCS